METQDIAALITRFDAAWYRGDVEMLTSMITDDCVYEASVGPEPGTRFVGKAEVRRGFRELMDYDADYEPLSSELTVFSPTRALMLWTIRRRADGSRAAQIRGCDVFESRNGLICRKDAFRKCGA